MQVVRWEAGWDAVSVRAGALAWGGPCQRTGGDGRRRADSSGGKAVEQGRAEQGDQAHRSLDARSRRGRAPWPAFRARVPDTGQRLAVQDGYVLALTYGP